jgi:hypothetical protein
MLHWNWSEPVRYFAVAVAIFSLCDLAVCRWVGSYSSPPQEGCRRYRMGGYYKFHQIERVEFECI